MSVIQKIISGGQTGVDRIALEVAREAGVATGGWAPYGWRTEIGTDLSLADFGMMQHKSPAYPPRTNANVRDSDGTVWLGDQASSGFKCTFDAVQRHNKPFLNNPTYSIIIQWAEAYDVHVLNVAGTRGSKLTPTDREMARAILVLALIKDGRKISPYHGLG